MSKFEKHLPVNDDIKAAIEAWVVECATVDDDDVSHPELAPFRALILAAIDRAAEAVEKAAAAKLFEQELELTGKILALDGALIQERNLHTRALQRARLEAKIEALDMTVGLVDSLHKAVHDAISDSAHALAALDAEEEK